MRGFIPSLFLVAAVLPAGDTVDLRAEVGLFASTADSDGTSNILGTSFNSSTSDNLKTAVEANLIGLGRFRTDVNQKYHVLGGIGIGLVNAKDDRSNGETTYKVFTVDGYGGLAISVTPKLDLEFLAHAGIGRLNATAENDSGPLAGADQDYSGTAFRYGARVGITTAFDSHVVLGGYAGYSWITSSISGNGTVGGIAYDVDQDVTIQGPEIGVTLGYRF